MPDRPKNSADGAHTTTGPTTVKQVQRAIRVEIRWIPRCAIAEISNVRYGDAAGPRPRKNTTL